MREVQLDVSQFSFQLNGTINCDFSVTCRPSDAFWRAPMRVRSIFGLLQRHRLRFQKDILLQKSPTSAVQRFHGLLRLASVQLHRRHLLPRWCHPAKVIRLPYGLLCGWSLWSWRIRLLRRAAKKQRSRPEHALLWKIDLQPSDSAVLCWYNHDCCLLSFLHVQLLDIRVL